MCWSSQYLWGLRISSVTRQKEANSESEAAGGAARLRKSGIQHESMLLNAGHLCEHTHETLWTLTCTNHHQIKHWIHSALWITARPAKKQTLSCNNITNIPYALYDLYQFKQTYIICTPSEESAKVTVTMLWITAWGVESTEKLCIS